MKAFGRRAVLVTSIAAVCALATAGAAGASDVGPFIGEGISASSFDQAQAGESAAHKANGKKCGKKRGAASASKKGKKKGCAKKGKKGKGGKKKGKGGKSKGGRGPR